jgi:hypothetical protein
MPVCVDVRRPSVDQRLAYYVRVGQPTQDDVPTIDRWIDGAAVARRSCVVLFPHVRSLAEIAALLGVLDASDRWACTHLPWRKHAREDAALVGLSWSTSAGPCSSVMGFATIGTMPVTRRAPYAAVAAWWI